MWRLDGLGIRASEESAFVKMTQTGTTEQRTESREMRGGQGNYCVITPAYNEEDHLQTTIDSMVLQRLRPTLWIIVDDGSGDRTWSLIENAAGQHPWIVGYRRESKRKPTADGLVTASEAQAFLDGYRIAEARYPETEFVVKLDADLEFDPNYFKKLIEQFQADPQLGIGGGVIYERRHGDLVREKVSRDHVRGATKIYRRGCYRDIGGMHPIFGWDVIDEMAARAKGWNVRSFDHVTLIHLRPTASRGGRFKGWARNGYMAYYIGMSPIRILMRSLYRLFAAGDMVQAGGLAYGYFSHFLTFTPKLPDLELRRLVQNHQWVTAKSSLPKRFNRENQE